MGITDGITGFLAYTALILAMLCAIGEKWSYFTSMLNEYERPKKKKKKKHKKKKKYHSKVRMTSNDEFYSYCGII